MLAPDDRQLLLSQLQPPPGMTLGHAVGATFTLDLESALVAPFSAASRVLADKLHPIAALEALRSTTDRIDISSRTTGQIPPASPAFMASLT